MFIDMRSEMFIDLKKILTFCYLTLFQNTKLSVHFNTMPTSKRMQFIIKNDLTFLMPQNIGLATNKFQPFYSKIFH